MRWLGRIAMAIVAIVMIAIAVAYMLPERVTVARSVVVDASPAIIFPLVNDLRAAQAWSPWRTPGDNIEVGFSGPASGVGQAMTWHSDNPAVGSGTQRIDESEPQRRVVSTLDFGDNGAGIAALVLEPAGEGATVTWTVDMNMGHNPVSRYIGLFMDDLLGDDFARGLATLKTIAERDATGAEPPAVDVAPTAPTTSEAAPAQ